LELQRTLGRLQTEGVTLIGDYDDLLFAGEVSGLPESAGGGVAGADRRARLAAYAEGLSVFEAFTVSTRALAVELQRRAPQARVTVVPNGVSETWLAQGRALYRRFRPGDPKVIRYFAGSPSHDRDFAGIIEPLARFLEQHRDVRLEVVGPVRFDETRFPNGSVAALRSVSYDTLPGLLASTWVNLAPLEPTAYNDCKSALKVLESGAFECPTLASPCDDVLRHHELGAPLLLCRSAEDWYESLVAMLDMERRAHYGRGVAEHIRAHGMARSALPAWLSALELGA
jgi:glycosyltransferase involved in cell wall biosynthesis